ncbi:MAG TPA: oligosaccharide flippase family protein [Myxococcales bacterium]|jgi:O-antigen/teichoic acid export membrane protein
MKRLPSEAIASQIVEPEMADASVVADTGHGVVRRTLQNALKLSGSLVLTWTIGLGIRLVLPRHLGPSAFGDFNFADAFAAAFCVLLNFGIDPWIRKEIAVRPAQASEFFAGVSVLRAVTLGGILVAIVAVLRHTGRSDEVIVATVLFGVSQYFLTANATLSAMLHATGNVDEMSLLSVLSKVLWGAMTVVGLFLGKNLVPFVLALLVSEGLECIALYLIARKHIGMRFRVDWKNTRRVLLASFPLYLTSAASVAYSKLDVNILAFKTGNAVEVGYYSAASSIAAIGLLLAPLVNWMLTPMLARAQAISEDELYRLMRRSLEAVCVGIAPCLLLLSLGSGFFVRLILGPDFAPSALALSIVAAALATTYLGVMASCYLVVLEKTWLLTAITVSGLFVNFALNVSFVEPAIHLLHRPGAGGAGCAAALFVSEGVAAAGMLWPVGRRLWDGRLVVAILKSLALCAAVAAVDRLALRGLPPVARLATDFALYLVAALAVRLLRPAELRALVVH